MTAKLEYNLPEERTEFNQAVFAADAWAYMYELDQLLRNHLKHGSTDHPFDSVEHLCQFIRSEMGPLLAKTE